MIQIIWIFISVILILITFCIIYFLNSSSKEEFTMQPMVDYTKDEVDQAQYNAYGMNRCSVLDLDPTKVDVDTYLMSREFIETNRIKEYTEKSTNDTTYCYLYDDKYRGLQDFILSDDQCSTEAQMFKGNDMIRNVYTDSNADKVHKYPIKKCIIEIDNKKASIDNLKRFYTGVKDSYCTSLANDLIQDILKKQSDFQLLSDKYSELDRIYRSNNDYYRNSMYQYTTCITSNNIYTSSNNYLNEANKIVSSKLENIKIIYDECSSNLDLLIENTKKELLLLQDETNTLSNTSIKSSKDLEACQLTYEDILTSITTKKQLAGPISQRIDKTYNNNSYLTLSNIECTGQVVDIMKEAAEYYEKYKECFPNIENYRVCNDSYIKCVKDREDCNRNREEYMKIYQDFYTSNVKCGNELKNKIIDLEDCTIERVKLEELNTKFKSDLEILNQLIDSLTKQRDECTINLTNRLAFKNELDNRTIELRSDKDYYKTASNEKEKEKVNSSIQLITTQTKFDTQLDIDTAKNNMTLNSSSLDYIVNAPNTVKQFTPINLVNEPYYHEKFNSKAKWVNATIITRGTVNPFSDEGIDIGRFPHQEAFWMWSSHNRQDYNKYEEEMSKNNTHIIHQFQIPYTNRNSLELQVNYYIVANNSGLLWFNYNDYALHNKGFKHNVEEIQVENKVVSGSYSLRPGLNTITINIINREFEGGVLFTMIDALTGQILLNSDNTWKCHIMTS